MQHRPHPPKSHLHESCTILRSPRRRCGSIFVVMRPSPNSRTSTLWLQLLLVGGLATVAILLVQTLRAARTGREVAERALRDYGAFAAWSYREHLVAEFRGAVDEILGPVNHGEGVHEAPVVPTAQRLGHLLPWNPACFCHEPLKGPLPRRFYAFVLGADTLGVGVNYRLEGRGWLADPLPDAGSVTVPVVDVPRDEAAWVNRLFTDAARAHEDAAWPYRLFVESRGDSTRVLATRLMPTRWGDTLVYGLEYSQRAIDSLFGRILTRSDLLPPSLVRGMRNEDIIDLEVADAKGRPIFRSRPLAGWELDAVNVLPAGFGGLQVRAQVRPELGASLLIGGTPASRVPVTLVLFAIALGVTLVAAVQLRRDVRFTADRASFVANVSHELRTPLTQVRLVLDTIRLHRDTDATMRQAALDLADREVLRLQHLVEGLLRFTRGPRQADVPRAEVDVAAEARSAASEFQPLATPRGITIEVTGAASATAMMQRGALRQVLLNLLDNAVKYGADNAPVVVEVSIPPGEGPRLTVTDSGPGVPDEERRRIWKAFERGTQARARAAGGSGIGLTIVRDIAAEHGGRAWVEDGPTGGASFVFQLPRAEP